MFADISKATHRQTSQGVSVFTTRLALEPPAYPYIRIQDLRSVLFNHADYRLSSGFCQVQNG